METKQFKLGDMVTWESQSRSYSTQKHGKVVEVIPAGQLPSKCHDPHTTMTRNHESYLVAVETGKRFGRPTYRWPRVKHLDLA